MKAKILLIFTVSSLLVLFTSCADVYRVYNGFTAMYGTAVRANPLRSDIQYRDFIKDHFSCIVSENALKMSNIHPKRDEYFWDDMDEIVDFAQNNDLLLKGHTLLWHYTIPDWFYDIPTCQERIEALRDHIRTVVERYKGKIKIYDVVNEPLSDEKFPNLLCMNEEEIIKETFSWVKETDPQASLSLNESGPEKSEEKREEFINLVKSSLDLGAPIDMIGIQAHFKESLPPLNFLKNNLIEIHERTALPIYITEFDISPPENPEDPFMGFENWYYYQMIAYRIAFDLFKDLDFINMIYMWGFSDKYHWRPGAGLLDSNMQGKPVMETIEPILIDSKCGNDSFHGSSYEGLYLSGDKVKLKSTIGPYKLINWRVFYGMDVNIDGEDMILPDVDEMKSLILKADVEDGGDYYAWYIILPDDIPTVPFEMECEDFPEKTQGNESNGFWNIWGYGHISVYLKVEETGNYKLELRGFGEYSHGEWPKVMLTLDEDEIAMLELNNEEPLWFEFDVNLKKGVHKLTIYFLNDYYNPHTGEDRNVFLDKVRIQHD